MENFQKFKSVIVTERMNVSYKVLLVGDCGVGKTSILGRLVNNSFSGAVQSTINFSNQVYQLNYEDSLYQLNFIDVPGQITYLNIMPIYFQNCCFAIAVFDLTSESSLNDLEMWIQKYREYGNEYSDILVIGNKYDMPNQISDEIIKTKIEELKIDYDQRYITVSAKTGYQYSDLLTRLGSIVQDFIGSQTPSTSNEVDLETKPTTDKQCCK